MFQSAFHLNNFKPWNPRPAKPPKSHYINKTPNPLRYPSSVSASFSSSPSKHKSPSTPCLLPVHNSNSKHHPLPARPPAEVCVTSNANAQSHIPRSARPPKSGTSPVSNSSHMNGSDCRTTPSSVEESDTRPTSPGLLGDIEHPTTDAPIELLSFEGSSAMDDLSSPCVSILEDGLEQLVQLPDASNTIPIDPKILTDGEPWNVSESYHAIQQDDHESAQETTCAYPEPPPTFQDVANSSQNSTDGGDNPLDCVPHISDHPRGKGDNQPVHLINHRHDSDTICFNVQDPKSHSCSSEPSTSCKWRSKAEQPERSSKRRRTITVSQGCEHSFTTLCSSFQSLPIDDRLQFLSWLFEGALPRCMPDCKLTTDGPTLDESQVFDQNNSRHGTGKKLDKSSRGRHNFRKHMPWSLEEKNLLVQLRREQKLSWSDVTRIFSEQFGGRSSGSIQVYWYTFLKDK